MRAASETAAFTQNKVILQEERGMKMSQIKHIKGSRPTFEWYRIQLVRVKFGGRWCKLVLCLLDRIRPCAELKQRARNLR